jgi:FKBP-type peptidyl-prolyl cis-trans isomerase
MRNSKEQFLGISVLVLSTAAVAALAGAAPAALVGAEPTMASRHDPARTSGDDAATYSLGLTFGGQLHHSGISQNLPMDALTRGIQDGLRGKSVTADDKQRAGLLLRSAHDSVGAANKALAREFLAKNSNVEGVKITSSGLQYRVVAAGSTGADSPKPTDEVTLKYRGRLLDGTEFDSSYSHGDTAIFKLNAVIKGWQEALPMMKPGAKWKLFVPPELAYDNYPPPKIPPGSLLIFDIELLKVGSSAPLNGQTPHLPSTPADPRS